MDIEQRKFSVSLLLRVSVFLLNLRRYSLNPFPYTCAVSRIISVHIQISYASIGRLLEAIDPNSAVGVKWFILSGKMEKLCCGKYLEL